MDHQARSQKVGLKKYERWLWIANSLLLVGFILFFAMRKGGQSTPKSLLQADPKTETRIGELEEQIKNNPDQFSKYLELAKLYNDAGEFPFSYNTLKNAEKAKIKEPGERLKLGIAFLEIGKNSDALRVIKNAKDQCQKEKCPGGLNIKLDIFEEICQKFEEKKIDLRKNDDAAKRVVHEIVKPANIDPKKLVPAELPNMVKKTEAKKDVSRENSDK